MNHQKLVYIIHLFLIVIAFSLIIWSIYFLLFATAVVGSNARNGLEAFSLFFFAFPAAVFYLFINSIFYRINRSIYKNLNLKNKITPISIIFIFLFSVLLFTFYSLFFDNLAAALIFGLIYGFTVVSGGLFDLGITHNSIWSTKNSNDSTAPNYFVPAILTLILILLASSIVIALNNVPKPPQIYYDGRNTKSEPIYNEQGSQTGWSTNTSIQK